ncbi:MAG: hypothetical protein U9O53_05120 [archaeon]|nr:hypothetical protein [archaeon]
MTGKGISLDKMTEGRTSPITIEIGGEERIVDVLRYFKHIDVPAPIDYTVKEDKRQSIPLGVTDSLDKKIFFISREMLKRARLVKSLTLCETAMILKQALSRIKLQSGDTCASEGYMIMR